MVKIFIGNLSQETEKDEVEALFTSYGTVTECAKYKNYAFVHMEDRKSATKAIRELHLHKLNGRPINVELSRGKGQQGPVKIHIANVEKGFDKELRELFEEYGTVSECAIVKNFAFVHMPNAEEALDAIQGLDNSEFQGKKCFYSTQRMIGWGVVGVSLAVSVQPFTSAGQCSSLSQESVYTFKYQKADPGGHQRRRIIHLRCLVEEAIILLATQWRGLSLHTEAACLLTLLLRLRYLLPREEQLTPTVVMASEMAIRWSITMKDSEPVLTAHPASMTDAPFPLLRRRLPRHWFESVLTRTSAVRFPLLLLLPP